MTEKETLYELHLIATVGDQNPHLDPNETRVQKAGEGIVEMLKPAGLWVIAAPDNYNVQTAGQLIDILEGNATNENGQVVRNHALDKDAMGRKDTDGWLMHFHVLASLALLKDKRKGPGRNTGLVLVTFPDIVEQLPTLLGEKSYDKKTDCTYGAVNHLAIKVDSSGAVADKSPVSK